MADLGTTTLVAKHPLGGLDRQMGAVRLRAIEDRALVSLACDADAREALSTLCIERLGVALPAIGCRSVADESITLLALQRDQTWCVFERTSEDPVQALTGCLGEAPMACLTDQSDGWATLTLEGDDALAVLERLCPLDLDTAVFGQEAVARTSMEHLAVVIQRSEGQGFELISPVSSIDSLRHAIETVALHVANERVLAAD